MLTSCIYLWVGLWVFNILFTAFLIVESSSVQVLSNFDEVCLFCESAILVRIINDLICICILGFLHIHIIAKIFYVFGPEYYNNSVILSLFSVTLRTSGKTFLLSSAFSQNLPGTFYSDDLIFWLHIWNLLFSNLKSQTIKWYVQTVFEYFEYMARKWKKKYEVKKQKNTEK